MVQRFTVPGALLALTFAAGCSPQNAQLTSGEWRAFLSETTSFTLNKDAISLNSDDFAEQWNVDCRALGGTPDANGNGTNEDEIEAIRLEPRAKVCGRNGKYPLALETWVDQGAYRVFGDGLDPWRGEAIITGEGDFQVMFHQRIPGGGDFRFGFAVDPIFQPTQCVQSESGEGTELANVDGDWLEGWSADLEGYKEQYDSYENAEDVPNWLNTMSGHFDGTLYYLNARSYQFNPEDTANAWSLPNVWRAGHTEGKFVEEFMAGRTTRYGKPTVYVAYELDDFETPNPEDMYFCGNDGRCTAMCNELNTDADVVASELGWAGTSPADCKGDGDPETADCAVEAKEWFRPLTHCNSWRDPDLDGPLEPGQPDGFSAGLDGWGEMHYSWVVIDPSSDLTEGGTASGAFALTLDGTDSQSRVFVMGEFEVPRIKRDRWTTDDINTIKLEQNNTRLCGQ